jgi:hypothetical protein
MMRSRHADNINKEAQATHNYPKRNESLGSRKESDELLAIWPVLTVKVIIFQLVPLYTLSLGCQTG